MLSIYLYEIKYIFIYDNRIGKRPSQSTVSLYIGVLTVS